MHYILILTVFAIIVIIQIRNFLSTKEKLADFENVFAEDKKSYSLQTKKLIETSHKNSILSTIFNSINNYLSNNKGKDFHLMKDIVDRNCDAAEEEIHTQIPVPLYLGLVGTMAGILIGVGCLVVSGSLEALLGEGTANNSAEGVKTLLEGVAIAMISSILGIILTTCGSNKAKTAKAEVERNKNTFLSWLQSELLPTMDDSITHTLETMAANLTEFNKTFTDNTTNLGTALAKVNESYRLQTDLIAAVNKIQEGRTAATNLQLLAKLIESSEQIGQLAEYLQNTNDYLANVKALNDKLDASEQRTKAIEEMATFFKSEISQVEQRKEAISKAVGTVDSILEERLRKLADHAGENVENFYKALDKQQDALQKRLDETQVIVSELKNLSAIKESISKFEKAASEQNRKIDKLAETIKELAQVKAGRPTTNSIAFPQWARIAAITGFTIITVSCAIIAGKTIFENNNAEAAQEQILPIPVQKIQPETNTIVIDTTAVVVDSVAE